MMISAKLSGTALSATAAMLLAAGPSWAQTSDEEAERLEDARARLEAAAREVAELSGVIAGEAVANVMENIEFAFERGMIGINIGAGDNDWGVPIRGVSPGGPADEAGLKSGDVITRLNGQPLAGEDGGTDRLMELMRDVEPGDEVSLAYLREGREEEVTLVAESMSPFAFAFGGVEPNFSVRLETGGTDPFVQVFPVNGLANRWRDMELVTLTPDLGEYFDTDEGLLVIRAPEDDLLQLRDGDVILEIDGREPTSPRHALRILRSYEGGEELRLDIIRKGRRRELTVSLPETEISSQRLSLGDGPVGRLHRHRDLPRS